jgi:glucosyl-dolichyl phosphate glucuronosyltransferase
VRFSIIVTTFNRDSILPLCLDALVKLDYKKSDYEVIIVDNNSSDNTKMVIETFQKTYRDVSIKYIFEKEKGTVHARHTGARNADYEYLAFIDDDGILNTTWLKEVAKIFSMNDNIAAVASKISIKWDRKAPEWIRPYEWLLGKLDYGNEAFYKKGVYVNGGSFNIKKKILFDLGGFDIDQIGDWLVGSGEDELNERLWNADYLIGYTPFAIMEHYQLVKKNGTIKDIKRRYKNLGIRIPYKLFVVKKCGYKYLLYNVMKRIKGIALYMFQFIFFYILNKKERVLLSMFLICHDSAQIKYTFKIFFNKKFREYLLNRNYGLKSD